MKMLIQQVVVLTAIACAATACHPQPEATTTTPLAASTSARPSPTAPTVAGPTTAAAPTAAPDAQFVPLSDPHLPNARWVTPNIINGGQPEGDAGFKRLHDLGVKTIISVDGISPNVKLAHKYHMRYVHLPFGYDGVPAAQGEAIAKALLEMPGPIYMHCHHGKHRSATATAVGCTLAGLIPPGEAIEILQTWGTGKNYKGLWQSARDARPMSRDALARLHVKYVEQAKIPPLAEAMVHVDFYADHLARIQKAGWQTPADHPDLDPPHEALQLEECFVEIGRSHAATTQPADFRQHLETTTRDVHALGQILNAPSIDHAAADRSLKRINQSCTACHAKYRD
jgi:protein tyrosine phosphatase (PTP) superfamily phosphohydrolase (DUF442 family)